MTDAAQTIEENAEGKIAYPPRDWVIATFDCFDVQRQSEVPESERRPFPDCDWMRRWIHFDARANERWIEIGFRVPPSVDIGWQFREAMADHGYGPPVNRSMGAPWRYVIASVLVHTTEHLWSRQSEVNAGLPTGWLFDSATRAWPGWAHFRRDAAAVDASELDAIYEHLLALGLAVPRE
jgi:hypothetical protein